MHNVLKPEHGPNLVQWNPSWAATLNVVWKWPLKRGGLSWGVATVPSAGLLFLCVLVDVHISVLCNVSMQVYIDHMHVLLHKWNLYVCHNYYILCMKILKFLKLKIFEVWVITHLSLRAVDVSNVAPCSCKWLVRLKNISFINTYFISLLQLTCFFIRWWFCIKSQHLRWPVSLLRQNGRHFPDDISKWIFKNENAWIWIKISFKFVPRGPINNIPASV